jgi:hypothetical protein
MIVDVALLVAAIAEICGNSGFGKVTSIGTVLVEAEGTDIGADVDAAEVVCAISVEEAVVEDVLVAIAAVAVRAAMITIASTSTTNTASAPDPPRNPTLFCICFAAYATRN